MRTSDPQRRKPGSGYLTFIYKLDGHFIFTGKRENDGPWKRHKKQACLNYQG